MQAFDIDNRLRGFLAAVIEDIGSAVEQLIFPLLNLVRMHVELLGELDHCLFTLDRGERDFCLKGGAVVAAGSFCHHGSCFGILPCSKAESHLSQLFNFPEPALAQRHFASTLGGTYFESSYLAVDIFFVLSGFVICHAYSKRLSSNIGVGQFLAIRLRRLYPMYILSLIVLCTYYFWSGVDVDITTALFAAVFLPNFWSASPFFLGSAWSLFCEWIVNIIYAVIAKTRFFDMAAKAVLIIGALGVIGSAIQYGGLDIGFRQSDILGGVFRALYGFFAGVVAYKYHNRLGHMPFYAGLICATLVVVSLTASVPASVRPLYDLCVLLLAPGIVFISSRALVPFAFKGICSFLGEISYPLYVLHLPMALIILSLINGMIGGPEKTIIDVLVWCFVMLASLLSWCAARYIDHPVRSTKIVSQDVL